MTECNAVLLHLHRGRSGGLHGCGPAFARGVFAAPPNRIE